MHDFRSIEGKRQDDLLEVLLSGLLAANAVEACASNACYDHISKALENACRLFGVSEDELHDLMVSRDYDAEAAVKEYRSKHGYGEGHV